MDAFWSATDDANENMTQFYGVWGKIKDEQPKFLFRWVSGEKKVNIDPSILFDIPQIETKTITTIKTIVSAPGEEPVIEETTEEEIKVESFKGPWDREEYPEDWMGQHEKKYSYTRSYGYGGNYGRNYGYRYKKDDDFTKKQSPTSSGMSKKTKAESDVDEKIKTNVDVFMDNAFGKNMSTVDIEDTVRYLVEQIIELGYDHIIADTVNENSGYGYYYQGYGYDYDGYGYY